MHLSTQASHFIKLYEQALLLNIQQACTPEAIKMHENSYDDQRKLFSPHFLSLLHLLFLFLYQYELIRTPQTPKMTVKPLRKPYIPNKRRAEYFIKKVVSHNLWLTTTY